jgi:ribosomal protein S14
MNVTEIPTQTVALRKFARELGLKGLSSANKATLLPLVTAEVERINAEREAELAEIELESNPNTKPVRQSRKCTECGRPEDFIGSQLCQADREYAESENAHSDENHESTEAPEGGDFRDQCWICHPELDERKPRGEGRSRAGMVIVAKGTEIHKSLTFKKAAEAIGWTVEIERETYELPESAEGEGTRYFATAVKGEQSISLAWDGRAYDYAASSAVLNGKGRKVRNLKEALRLL